MLMEALALFTFTSVSSSTTATLHVHSPWSVALMLLILIPQSTSASLVKCSSLPPSVFSFPSRGYRAPYGVVQLQDEILVEARQTRVTSPWFSRTSELHVIMSGLVISDKISYPVNILRRCEVEGEDAASEAEQESFTQHIVMFFCHRLVSYWRSGLSLSWVAGWGYWLV